MMEAHGQLQRLCALGIALVAAACGGDMQQQPASDPFAATTAAAEQANSGQFIVPMSMVIPKKPITPPVTTTTSTPATGQLPAGTGFPTTPGAGAAPAGAPAAGAAPAPGAAPAAMPGTPPGAGAAGAPAVMTGMAAAAGAAAPATGAGADNNSGVPDDELAMLRDVCVAEINMYRASLTDRMLTPITRATADQEACSQQGAKMDGDSMQAHGAARAGLCRSVGLSSENTCPGWPVGAGGWGGGNATIADALKGCLKAMWDEGEPPDGRDACIQDQAGCFQAHGHYLNMSDPNIESVACSFYKMSDGRSYWMNQDFTANWGGWGRQ